MLKYDKNFSFDKFEGQLVALVRMAVMAEKPGFSITFVSCPDCGGSFDAVRQRICPYCGKEYHMENESWIIEKMSYS